MGITERKRKGLKVKGSRQGTGLDEGKEGSRYSDELRTLAESVSSWVEGCRHLTVNIKGGLVS